MASKHSPLSTPYYAHILDQLPIREALQEELLEVFAGLEPGHGMRAMALSSVQTSIEAMGPSAVKTWDGFCRQFPTYDAHSFLPLAEAYLMLFRQATLRFPMLPLEDALHRAFREDMSALAQTPHFKIAWSSCEQRTPLFLELIARNHLLLNYGEAWLEHLGPGHVVMHHSQHYSVLAGLIVVPYFEGLFDAMGARVQATFELLNPHSFDVELKW